MGVVWHERGREENGSKIGGSPQEDASLEGFLDDTATKSEDLTLMTLESHLLNQQYNDLGFIAGGRIIILVEAQSTWSVNIVIRAHLYLAESWNKYIKRREYDLYDSDKMDLPKPEVYVIYTGRNPKAKPSEISIRKDFFEDEDVAADCRVKVITDGRKGDIISQYVRFCHVFNEQVKVHGRTRKAAEETIRICQDEDVLRDYLERQRMEVIDMMTVLFDQETLMRNHDATLKRKERKAGRAEGRAEGHTEGREEITTLMNYLLSNGRVDDALRASEDKEYLEELLAEFSAAPTPRR